MEKKYTFKEFREFLAEKCWNEKEYGNGKYDRKIYNWFDINKPRKVEFFKGNENLKNLENQNKF